MTLITQSGLLPSAPSFVSHILPSTPITSQVEAEKAPEATQTAEEFIHELIFSKKYADIPWGERICLALYRLEVVDENFVVRPKFEEIPFLPLPQVTLDALQELLKKELIGKFKRPGSTGRQDNDAEYEIGISYLEFIQFIKSAREYYFTDVNSICHIGSAALQKLQEKWRKQNLINLAPKSSNFKKLVELAILTLPNKGKHKSDIDTFFDASKSVLHYLHTYEPPPRLDVFALEAFLDRQLAAIKFSVLYKNHPDDSFESFQDLVFDLAGNKNKEVTGIFVANTAIPWVKGRVLLGDVLKNFIEHPRMSVKYGPEKNYGFVKSVLILGCNYILQKEYTDILFWIEKSVFHIFHKTTFKRITYRMECYDRQNDALDFTLVHEIDTPNVRVRSQESNLELKPAIIGQGIEAAFYNGSHTGLLHASNGMHYFVAEAVDNQTKWAFFWWGVLRSQQLIGNTYPKHELNQTIENYCFSTRPKSKAQGLSDALTGWFYKCIKEGDPSFAFPFFFNPLTHLPNSFNSLDIKEAWKLLAPHCTLIPDPLLEALAQPLRSGILSHKIVASFLHILAFRYLASSEDVRKTFPFTASLPMQGKEKMIRLTLSGHAFLFEANPFRSYDTFASAYAQWTNSTHPQDRKKLVCLQNLMNVFGEINHYDFDPEATIFHHKNEINQNNNFYVNIARINLKTDIGALVKQGFGLLLLDASWYYSDISWTEAMVNLPKVLRCENSLTSRTSLLKTIQTLLVKYAPGISNQQETTFNEYLNTLMEKPLEKEAYYNALVNTHHIQLVKIALNIDSSISLADMQIHLSNMTEGDLNAAFVYANYMLKKLNIDLKVVSPIVTPSKEQKDCDPEHPMQILVTIGNASIKQSPHDKYLNHFFFIADLFQYILETHPDEIEHLNRLLSEWASNLFLEQKKIHKACVLIDLVARKNIPANPVLSQASELAKECLNETCEENQEALMKQLLQILDPAKKTPPAPEAEALAEKAKQQEKFTLWNAVLSKIAASNNKSLKEQAANYAAKQTASVIVPDEPNEQKEDRIKFQRQFFKLMLDVYFNKSDPSLGQELSTFLQNVLEEPKELYTCFNIFLDKFERQDDNTPLHPDLINLLFKVPYKSNNLLHLHENPNEKFTFLFKFLKLIKHCKDPKQFLETCILFYARVKDPALPIEFLPKITPNLIALVQHSKNFEGDRIIENQIRNILDSTKTKLKNDFDTLELIETIAEHPSIEILDKGIGIAKDYLNSKMISPPKKGKKSNKKKPLVRPLEIEEIQKTTLKAPALDRQLQEKLCTSITKLIKRMLTPSNDNLMIHNVHDFWAHPLVEKNLEKREIASFKSEFIHSSFNILYLSPLGIQKQELQNPSILNQTTHYFEILREFLFKPFKDSDPLPNQSLAASFKDFLEYYEIDLLTRLTSSCSIDIYKTYFHVMIQYYITNCHPQFSINSMQVKRELTVLLLKIETACAQIGFEYKSEMGRDFINQKDLIDHLLALKPQDDAVKAILLCNIYFRLSHLIRNFPNHKLDLLLLLNKFTYSDLIHPGHSNVHRHCCLELFKNAERLNIFYGELGLQNKMELYFYITLMPPTNPPSSIAFQKKCLLDLATKLIDSKNPLIASKVIFAVIRNAKTCFENDFSNFANIAKSIIHAMTLMPTPSLEEFCVSSCLIKEFEEILGDFLRQMPQEDFQNKLTIWKLMNKLYFRFVKEHSEGLLEGKLYSNRFEAAICFACQSLKDGWLDKNSPHIIEAIDNLEPYAMEWFIGYQSRIEGSQSPDEKVFDVLDDWVDKLIALYYFIDCPISEKWLETSRFIWSSTSKLIREMHQLCPESSRLAEAASAVSRNAEALKFILEPKNGHGSKSIKIR